MRAFIISSCIGVLLLMSACDESPVPEINTTVPLGLDEGGPVNQFTPISTHDLSYLNGIFDVYVVRADELLVQAFSIYENKSKLSEADIYESMVNSKNCFFLTASIVDNDCMPLGLFIKNGQKVNDVNLRKGEGNFYMGPTGILAITERGASILDPNKYHDSLQLDFAIQSGPLLIKKGEVNPWFNTSSKNLTYRSGVGIYKIGQETFLVFAKSNSKVSFYTLASLFKHNFQCTDAMTLECGPIVSGFLPNTSHTPRKDVKPCNYIRIQY